MGSESFVFLGQNLVQFLNQRQEFYPILFFAMSEHSSCTRSLSALVIMGYRSMAMINAFGMFDVEHCETH